MRLKLIIPTTLVLVCSGSWVASTVVDYDKWLAFSLNDAAWHQIENNNTGKAKEYIWRAMSAAKTPGVLNTAGMIAFGENNDHENAFRYLNDAIEQNPNYPDSYYNRARIEAALGKRENAYQSYALYLEFVSTERPGTTDYKYDTTLSALSFTAQLDLENGNLEQALERLLFMRDIYVRRHVSADDFKEINIQIEHCQKEMYRRSLEK